MNDRELEKLLTTGTLGSGQPMVAIPGGPNGAMQEVPAEIGNFFMLQQITLQLQQVNVRLEALHQHIRVKEHARSAGRSTCPVCIVMDQAERVPDPEGDVKEDIEKAKAVNRDGLVYNDDGTVDLAEDIEKAKEAEGATADTQPPEGKRFMTSSTEVVEDVE